MNCDEADELLAAFALDALPADEARAVRRHVETCARHARALAELRAASSSLALTVEEPPPAPLRDRIVAAAANTQGARDAVYRTGDSGREGRGAVGRAAARLSWAPRGPVGRLSWAPRGPVGRLSWAPLAAAAAIIVALAVWNVVLLRQGDSRSELTVSGPVRLAPIEAEAGESGFVAYFPDAGRALFVADGLQPLDGRTSTYQLWSIADGQVESLGLLGESENGSVAVTVPLDDAAGRTLAVTVEPAGGSDQPTSEPILRARL